LGLPGLAAVVNFVVKYFGPEFYKFGLWGIIYIPIAAPLAISFLIFIARCTV